MPRRIWHLPVRLPTPDEARPAQSLLEAGGQVSRLHAMRMHRIPGQCSYTKAIGEDIGNMLDDRVVKAWVDVAAMGASALEPIAVNFVATECSHVNPEQQAVAHDFLMLLLSADGIDLLQHIAVEWKEFTLEMCWAW